MHDHSHHGRRRMPAGLWTVLGTVLLTAAVLSACLVSCSGEILNTETGPLTIAGETGGSSAITLPSDSETESGISIRPSGDPYENAPHVMRVDFLDTGDADAILVRMDDTVILVDTGEADDYHKITTTLTSYGITAIDYLILTHYDNDHIGTATQLLKNVAVGTVYMPDYVRDSRLYRTLADTLEVLSADGKVTVFRPQEDVHIDLAYGSLWINPTHLYEPGHVLGSDDAHSLEENNYSLIVSLSFGDTDLLLAGDAEGDRMAEFAALVPEGTSYDVFKIPHHGGYDKELSDFLRAAKGDLRYCVVSVGSSDLVEASLVTAMRAAGAGAYYTYNGDIHLVTDGKTMTLEQE